MGWLKILFCYVFQQHQLVLRCEGDHVFLACPCGYETPGYRSRVVTGA